MRKIKNICYGKDAIYPAFRRKVAFLARHIVFFLLLLTCATIKQLSAQNITIGSYTGQSEISTYNGMIKLQPGFVVSGGQQVHIYIKEGNPPNGNGDVPAAPSAGMNYLMSWTAAAPITDAASLMSRPARDVALSVEYFDGLGRPLQTVVRQGSLPSATGTATDMVIPVEYDAFGRQDKSYLPYAATSADASYKSGAVGAQAAFYADGNQNGPLYKQGETMPYSQTIFENSPLDRVLKVMAPGKNWAGNGNGVSSDYLTNEVSDNVRIWNVETPSADGSFSKLVSPKAYDAGQLYKTVTTDEGGKKVIEFKDKDGRVVLKKVQMGSDWMQTCYIYDDLGNLRCVVQPEGMAHGGVSGILSDDVLNEQCFRYEYDGRNRMVTKKVPGAGALYMVYDQRDRLVMTQDANMQAQGKWIVTEYDNLNRPFRTYNTTYGSGHAALQQEAMASAIPYAPGDKSDVLSVTHYDDYDGLPSGVTASLITDYNSLLASGGAWPYPQQPVAVTPQSAVSTKGLVTWTQSRVLDGSAGVQMLASSNFYDDKGRLIQIQSQNITGGMDVVTTQYTWSGKPLIVVTKTDKKGAQEDNSVVVQRYSYDELFRVVKTEQRIAYSRVNNNNMTDWVTLSEVQYDGLGQMKVKKVGRKRDASNTYTTTPIETQDYDYNVRGWLLGVNRAFTKEGASTDDGTPPGGEEFSTASGSLYDTYSRLWGFDLAYDKVGDDNKLIGDKTFSATQQLTGNIAGMVWKTATRGRVRKYDFSYDDGNRLKEANYKQFVGGDFATTAGDFSSKVNAYDLNGNIKGLEHMGLKKDGSQATIDNLVYSYDKSELSNRLIKVTDNGASTANDALGDFQDGNTSGNDYAYDGNGNLTRDENKKLSISYNYLNLPQAVNVDGKGSVSYVYDAGGNKLKKITVDIVANKTTTTLYLGAAQYTDDQLQFFGNGEGRTRIVNNAYVLDYFLKDHLGNTRLVVTDQQGLQSPVLEETHYYPFGLTMKGISSTQSSTALQNKYQYNGGTELQSGEFSDGSGLELYATPYRSLDPQLGRFWQVDALASISGNLSPFTYASNNPILRIDPLGLIDDKVDQDGNVWHGLEDVAVGGNNKNSSLANSSALSVFNFNAASYREEHAQRVTYSQARDRGIAPKNINVPNNLKQNFETGWKAENDGRKMQLGAIAIIGAPVALTAAPSVIVASMQLKLGMNTTALVVDAAAQSVANGMRGKNIFSNYNPVSGLVSFSVGIPEGAMISNTIGVNLLSSAAASSINLSVDAISNQKVFSFSPSSILIGTAFGVAGGSYSGFISNSTGVSNAVGDALASPFIVGGSVIDGKVNQ